MLAAETSRTSQASWLHQQPYQSLASPALQPSLGSWEGPCSSQLGACSPAWTLLLEGESEELSLHTFARVGAREGSEASGRCLDFPLLKLEGTRCGGRGGRVHGREGGGKEGTKERGREQLGALPAVLQAQGFIEHNMPRNKRE